MRCRFTTRPITRSRSYTTDCLSRPILGMSTGLQSRDRSLRSAIGSRLARHHRVVTVETRKHPWIDATAKATIERPNCRGDNWWKCPETPHSQTCVLRSLGMYGHVLRRSVTIFADKFKLLYP